MCKILFQINSEGNCAGVPYSRSYPYVVLAPRREWSPGRRTDFQRGPRELISMHHFTHRSQAAALNRPIRQIGFLPGCCAACSEDRPRRQKPARSDVLSPDNRRRRSCPALSAQATSGPPLARVTHRAWMQPNWPPIGAALKAHLYSSTALLRLRHDGRAGGAGRISRVASSFGVLPMTAWVQVVVPYAGSEIFTANRSLRLRKTTGTTCGFPTAACRCQCGSSRGHMRRSAARRLGQLADRGSAGMPCAAGAPWERGDRHALLAARPAQRVLAGMVHRRGRGHGRGRKVCTWSARKPFCFSHSASFSMSSSVVPGCAAMK